MWRAFGSCPPSTSRQAIGWSPVESMWKKPGSFATTCATESGEEHVSISQVRYVPGRYEEEFPVGDAPTMDVTVREQPGLWVEGAKLGIRNDNRGGSELYGVNVLIWEEEDDLFRVTSNELTLEELLKIAESLK